MKIALIADTHIPTSLARLPDVLLKGLRGADAILHAGDIVAGSVLKELNAIAPTTAVFGNMDPPELARDLSDRVLDRWDGRTIGLKHGHQPHGVQSHYISQPYDSPAMTVFFQLMASQLPGAQIIVFGHFHRAVITTWHDILFINPGAVAPSHGGSSYAILELGEAVTARIVSLP
jgi:uncharacterized protein